MARLVLLIGESGTGKTASLRNFAKNEASVFNVSKKDMPFKSALPEIKTDDYTTITRTLKRATAKSIIIDDAQYLMAFEFMARSKERGFDKFTDIGNNFFNLIQTARNLPNDKIVYFFSHIEKLNDGFEKAKTIGKLLDEKITVEGLFTIVLKTVVSVEEDRARRFLFSTVNNGMDTVKTSIGMFADSLIPNDLKIVDQTLREYYNI